MESQRLSFDEDTTFSVDTQRRKGYFVSRGQAVVCFIAILFLLILVAALSVTFSRATTKGHDTKKGKCVRAVGKIAAKSSL